MIVLKVKLWGMPPLSSSRAEKGSEFEVDFDGETVRDLIRSLFFEAESKDPHFSSQLQIILNGRFVSEADRLDHGLRNGDAVELILAPG
jgi:sulfur carrier protein ThiS